LRRLSKAHVVYETLEAQRGAWDGFSMRNIGLALQRRTAQDFGGDFEAMRRPPIARVGRLLNIDPERLPTAACNSFADFAMVLSLIPDLPRWTRDEKRGLGEIIAAKAARTELRYLVLLQKHARLRTALLKLGSQA
jgi:hypothetical protein